MSCNRSTQLAVVMVCPQDLQADQILADPLRSAAAYDISKPNLATLAAETLH